MNDDDIKSDDLRMEAFRKYLSTLKLMSESDALAEEVARNALKVSGVKPEDTSLSDAIKDVHQYVLDYPTQVDTTVSKLGLIDRFKTLMASTSGDELKTPEDQIDSIFDKFSPSADKNWKNNGDVEIGEISVSNKFNPDKVVSAVSKALKTTIIPVAITGVATYAMTSAALPVVGALMVRKAASTLIAPHVFKAVGKVFGEDSKSESCARFGAFVKASTGSLKNTLTEKLGITKLVNSDSKVVKNAKSFMSKHPDLIKYSLMAATTVLGLTMSTGVLDAAQEMPMSSPILDAHGSAINAGFNDAVSPVSEHINVAHATVDHATAHAPDHATATATAASHAPDHATATAGFSGTHDVKLGELKGGLTQQIEHELKANGVHFDNIHDKNMSINHVLSVIKEENGLSNIDSVKAGQVLRFPDLDGVSGDDLTKMASHGVHHATPLSNAEIDEISSHLANSNPHFTDDDYMMAAIRDAQSHGDHLSHDELVQRIDDIKAASVGAGNTTAFPEELYRERLHAVAEHGAMGHSGDPVHAAAPTTAVFSGTHDVKLGELKGGLTQQIEHELKANGVHFDTIHDKHASINHMLDVIKAENGLSNIDSVKAGQVLRFPDLDGVSGDDLVKMASHGAHHVVDNGAVPAEASVFNASVHQVDVNTRDYGISDHVSAKAAAGYDEVMMHDFSDDINAFISDPHNAAVQDKLYNYFEKGYITADNYNSLPQSPTLPDLNEVMNLKNLLTDLHSDNPILAETTKVWVGGVADELAKGIDEAPALSSTLGDVSTMGLDDGVDLSSIGDAALTTAGKVAAAVMKAR